MEMRVSLIEGASPDPLGSSWDRRVFWKRYVHYMEIVYAILCIGTLGVFFIFCKMYPDVKMWMLTKECMPFDADIIVFLEDGKLKVIDVEKYEVDGCQICSFDNGSKRMVATSKHQWKVTQVPDVPLLFLDLLRSIATNSSQAHGTRQSVRAHYGDNQMRLPVASFWDILAVTVVHPFYLFQYFSVGIWYELYLP